MLLHGHIIIIIAIFIFNHVCDIIIIDNRIFIDIFIDHRIIVIAIASIFSIAFIANGGIIIIIIIDNIFAFNIIIIIILPWRYFGLVPRTCERAGSIGALGASVRFGKALCVWVVVEVAFGAIGM